MKVWKNKETYLKDRNIYRCILLCCVIGVISFSYYMYVDGGIFTVADDFNVQQIPFLTAMNHYIKNGMGMWRWNVDLGTQMIGAYSFYNLGSPFVWLTFLFPKASVPYLTGGLYVLKYIVAGVTAYLYLRMFVKNRQYALIGGVLYAFSGFQSVNLLFFHFHDTVALFPLMLLGLEKLVDERKKALFIMAVFLNCMTNYFFFISEVIFLVLYYILRFWKRNFIRFLKDAMVCSCCGIIGTGMAAFMFLPSILYIAGNSKANTSIHFLSLLSYAGYILLSIKGFLLPGEAMARQSCVVAEDYMSTCCYIPLIGGSLAFAYMLTKKKDWLTKLLVILWIISCSPIMDSAFYLFTQHYKRWWFMFVLMLVTASVKVLDDIKHYRVKSGIVVNILILILFGLTLMCLDRTSGPEYNFIFRKDIFFIGCGISLLGLMLTWFWCSGKGRETRAAYYGFAGCAAVFCAVTTFYTLTLYREYAETGREYLRQYQLGLRLKNIDDQYRYNLSNNVLTFTGEAAGVGSFSSTISNSIHEFDEMFDFAWENQKPLSDFVVGVRELLGAKYDLSEELMPEQALADMVTVEDAEYYILEKDVCPIGFSQDSYITKDELKLLPVDMRGIAMIDNLVIDSGDEKSVAQYLWHNDRLNYTEDHSELSELVSRSQKDKVTDFKRNADGFECEVTQVRDRAVFFSVPYDKGWSAYVNGQKTDIFNCGGMMGILTSAGQSEISFRYQTPGFKTGVWMSAFFSGLFVLLVYFEQKNRGGKRI